MKRIGVFICWCGSNIAGTVDIKSVVKAAKQMPGVVYVEDNRYTCSEIGQKQIEEGIKNYKLDGVVVGSCSPRMHELTFRKTVARAGLNPYMLEIANLREHCSWVHKDMDEGTLKAISLVRVAVAKVARNEELFTTELDVEKHALVIGGGVAGIQVALDIADAGYTVDLVEKEPTIGGRMSQLDKTFPTLDCSACILTPKMVEAAQHEKINLLTYSEIEEVQGFVGNFTVKIRQKARSVDIDKCTGCGVCWEKCPSKVDSEYDFGLQKRKAIYVPFPQAVPKVPVIDRENCRYFLKGKCKVCSKVCPAEAIDYEQEDVIITRKYGAITVATGIDILDLKPYGEYSYGKHPDVITSMQFERLINASGPTGGNLVKLSNGETPKNVVFVQCVGSRDKARGKNYCSKICCMYTAKHAILLKEKMPDAQAYVFYIDNRTAGKGYEEFHRRACEKYGVVYLRGNVGKVYPDGDKLIVHGIDSLSGQTVEIDADLVVLAAAVTARNDATALGRLLGLTTDEYSFFNEAHPKLRPVETHSAGIYLAGACQSPKDIPDAVAQASGAAAKVIGLLSKESLLSDPMVSEVNTALCSGCLNCEAVCPYGAISSKTIEEKVGRETVERIVAEVNNALCQGCGSCTVACRPGAIDLKGFTNDQLLAEVDAICL